MLASDCAAIGQGNRNITSGSADMRRILGQIERNEVRVGPDAAREIARRIEDAGGFWGPRKVF